MRKIETVAASKNLKLPTHDSKHYASVGECIYCKNKGPLTKEHIIPFSAGGRWVLPDSSCKECSAVTGAFEGEFSRTILGPLRMLYNMPTRRPKDRPDHLPLKVKYPHSNDWEIAYVDRSICPFLVGLPLYPLPDLLTGNISTGNRSAAVSQIWIRGAGFWPDREAQMEWLCKALGATEVMPAATLNAEPFCLTLAKIAHSFVVAELGMGKFEPFLCDLIRDRDLSNRADFIGGGSGNEPASELLHELSFDKGIGNDHSIIAVKIRLFGILEAPTYHVAVGRKLE